MESESTFLKSWSIVIASLIYCYFIPSKIPKGKIRLISILPVVSIFTILPLLHTPFYMQFHLGACIAWFANFKLLLFAFGKDDTLSVNPSMSLLHFIILTALPVKVKHNTPRKPKNIESLGLPKFPLTFVVNALIWSVAIQMYMSYKHHPLITNPIIVHILYTARLFFGLQVHLELLAALARLFLGRQEIEKQFNKPHLSTSLQDFWGRRWNLTVSALLKSAIHEPTKSFFTPKLGNRCALHLAIIATYAVSGLMHEVMYFYVGRRWPTWEVMWFFVIHGVCLSTEIEVKRISCRKGWKLHPGISLILTAGFVMTTAIWLCFAELIHCGVHVREIEEYIVLFRYIRDNLRS